MGLDLLRLGAVLAPGRGLGVEKIFFPVFPISRDVTGTFEGFQDVVCVARWEDLHVRGCVHEDLESFPRALYFGVAAEAETEAVVGQSHLARVALLTCTKKDGVSHCRACWGRWGSGSVTSECANWMGAVVYRW